MVFKKGNIPWNNKLNKETNDSLRKMSLNKIGKVSPRKGVKLLDITKEKIRKANIGKKRSKESIDKQKKTLKRRYKNGEIKSWNKNIPREQQPRYGKKLPKEWCEKISKNHWDSSGKNNPNFNNWSSREPYGKEFSPQLKEQIRNKYNYRCQECFREQDELRSKNNRKYKLLIHHIDYNKQNNNENNLISLCRNCHSQTNFDRGDWKEYFQDKGLHKSAGIPKC